MRYILSIRDDPLRDLLPRWIATLKNIPASNVSLSAMPNGLGQEDIDGRLIVELPPGRRLIYGVECKRHLAPIVDQAVRQARRAAEALHGHPLIMAEYVNAALGARLRREGVDYIDAVGNASLTRSPLCVILGGAKPPPHQHSPGISLNSKAGLQLTALLLTDGQCVQHPLRSIAQAAGISLGATSGFMRELRKLGFIRGRPGHLTNLGKRADLLEQWTTAYIGRLRPKLLARSYRTTEGRIPTDLIPLLKNSPDILVGGELAAAMTTGLFRAARVSLHITPSVSHEGIMQRLRLLPDGHGNVDVFTHFGSGDVWSRRCSEGVPLAADPLVYAELLITNDDRLSEALNYYQREIIQNDKPTVG